MRIRQSRRIVFFSILEYKNRQWAGLQDFRERRNDFSLDFSAFGRAGLQDFRERRNDFSLDFSAFGQSVRFRPRSKAVLRSEGYAWTPIW